MGEREIFLFVQDVMDDLDSVFSGYPSDVRQLKYGFDVLFTSEHCSAKAFQRVWNAEKERRKMKVSLDFEAHSGSRPSSLPRAASTEMLLLGKGRRYRVNLELSASDLSIGNNK